ncbi:helix-turn-helix domain-containing protein [Paracoccus sp. S-4012]|uniref:GlxA family transcriptional regulator n=1 Tax=Paracoccus sp. S-4012 TaxID=2665648 RepID=UPI0012B014A9|nr:GlxA family transcriptional regulator [Paracoccus sp. S-4012]MRX50425.1 helix-turn-helix domain-containing protein [Paracoccus sp. S-4012]
MAPASPFNLTFVLFDGFSNMVLASAIEPLRAACDLSGRRLFSWQLASPEGAAATSSSRLSIGVDLPLASVGATDALILVAGYGVRDHLRRETLQAILQKVRGMPLIGGFDTGAWLLAAAGVLTGRRASIHWMEREALAEAFPEILVEDAPVVRDGPFLTCGGAQAVLNWSLDLIGHRADPALQFDVSNMFGRDPSHGNRPPLPNRPEPMQAGLLPPSLQRAVVAMRQTADQPQPLARIAERAAVSERTLDRLMRAHLGVAAGQYYRTIRLAHARALATETKLPLPDIAARTGFASASTLARAYRKHYCETLGESRRHGNQNRSPARSGDSRSCSAR